MRISKRVREDAIEACLLRADQWLAGPLCAADDLPVSAHDAFAAIVYWPLPAIAHPDETFAVWLEAAALLRDGWNPGDPVHLLGASR